MPLLLLLVAAVALWVLSRKGSAQSFSPALVSDASASSPETVATAPVVSSAAVSYQSQGNQLDNITQAIAQLEGFGIPGARPTRDNNPGDVRSAPGMIGQDSGGIAQFADVGDGWDALGNWVNSHVKAHPDWDFYDLTHYYATGDTLGTPASGEADPDKSAEFIAGFIGVDPTTLVSSVLEMG